MQSFALFLVFACIASCFGKPLGDDNQCHTPDQLHGHLFLVTDSGVVLDMDYQNDNKQRAQRFTSNKGPAQFDTISLYDQKLQYTVVADGKYCHVSQINHEFYPMGVPAGFSPMESGKLAGEIDVTLYGWAENDTGVMIVMAQESCTPALILAKVAGTISLMSYLDTATGVDADAFTIPEVCKKSSNVRRGLHPNVAHMKRGMAWEVPTSNRGQPWLKL